MGEEGFVGEEGVEEDDGGLGLSLGEGELSCEGVCRLLLGFLDVLLELSDAFQ
jgi:hypothetical protein